MFKKYYIIISLLLTFSINAQHKVHEIDSIIEVAKKMGDSLQSQAILLSENTYAASKKLNYIKGMIDSRLIASRNSYDLGKYDDVIKYTLQVENYTKNKEFVEALSEAKQLAGMGYTELGFYDKGKTELDEGLLLARKITDNDIRNFRFGFVYTGIAVNYDRRGYALDSIILYHQKALYSFSDISNEKSHKNTTLSLAYSNLGLCYAKKGDNALAEETLLKALELSKDGSKHIRAYSLLELANLYNEDGTYTIAIGYYSEGILLAKKLNNPYILKEMYNGISESYASLKDTQNAQIYLKKYTSISDSLSIVEKKALQTPLNYIIDEKDDRFGQFKKNWTFIAGGTLLILAILIFFYTKRNVQQKKNYKKIIKKLESQREQRIFEDKKEEFLEGQESNRVTISQSKEKEILKNLEKFVKQKKFLNQEINATYLANELNTNTKYLSEVIKKNTDKNFNAYINGLRIDYIVQKLYSEKVYREYKISYLAEESGFSSREVFTTIFKKEISISPYNFIKSLNKDNS